MSCTDFPSAGLIPNVTTHTVGNITYIWTGIAWESQVNVPAGELVNDLSQAYIFDTVADYEASTIVFPVGKTIHLLDRGADFSVIIGTGAANGKKIIASTEVNQSIDLVIDDNLSLKALGELRDDSTDNTDVIQFAINLAASNGINEIVAGSGVSRFTKLYFTYDSVNNTGFPSTVRTGWGLKFKGKGRLYTEDVNQIEVEIAATLGSVFRSTITTGIPINLIVEDPSTVQQGLQFKDVGFIADNTDLVITGSGTPASKLFDNVSVHQKNDGGSGVLLEDVWVSTWGDVLIAGRDTTGTQTGNGLVVRNRLFAGGGMWNWGNINIRGFKNSGAIGYMSDPGFPVKLLDSIIINVLQSRNAENGMKIGGKVRSLVMGGYHTESCTVTGGQIAAEAGSVLILGSYWDCGLCSTASLVLGNGAGVVGANLDETTWSEVELRAFNFIDVNAVGIKVADGTKGTNLVLATGKLGKVSGAGVIGIDFDNFEGDVRLSNVRYAGLTTEVANRPNAVSFINNGNFEAYKSSLIEYQKESINVEALVSTKFLSAEDPANQVITPDASNARVVLPNPTSKRNYTVHNTGAVNINMRDNTNTTTLKSIVPSETFKCISDGTDWFFI